MFRLLHIVSFTLLLLLMHNTGCSSKKEKKGHPDYDLSAPEKFVMPESLLEISGITFRDLNNDTVYAIQDEEGKLFRLAWGVKKQYHSKFGKKGDYEDVAIAGNSIVILKSNGTLYSFPFEDAIYEEVDSAKEWKAILPEGEYEGLYADSSGNKLYVLCKHCGIDNAKDSVSIYVVDWNKETPAFTTRETVAVDAIKASAGKVKGGFRPSGLAKNPKTGEWFIISAINKLLVVTDGNWKTKETYPLNGNIFIQPEGICFDREGNLYISNEGDDFSSGNILKFKRKAK